MRTRPRPRFRHRGRPARCAALGAAGAAAALVALAILSALAAGGLAQEGAPPVAPAPPVADFEAVPGVPSLDGARGTPGASGTPGDPVRLSPRLRPGHTYRYVGEIVLRGELPGRGTRELRLEQQARIDVSERTGRRRGLALRVRSERLKLDLRGPGETLAFDSLSNEDRASPLGRHFRSELFRWVDLELNADLRVVSAVEDGRVSAEEEQEGFAELPRFGPEELRRFVETLLQGLPERAVAPGEIWTLEGSRSLENAVSYDFELHHRYLGEVPFEGHPCHRIAIGGRLTGSAPPPRAEGADQGRTSETRETSETPETPETREPRDGTRIDVAASSIEGEILFDPALGLPRHLRHVFRLVLEVPREGGAGEPLRIPVEQEMELRFLQAVESAP